MKTLYIDVYFLLNFTVDALAIYFSLMLCKAPSSIKRITLGALIGAIASCITVLTRPHPVLFALILLVSLAAASYASSRRIGPVRRFRLFVAILFFETLIGGIVFWIYSLLERIIPPFAGDYESGAQNKNMLLLSVIILLSMGIIKLGFRIYNSSTSIKSAEIIAEFLGKTVTFQGLIDSGNLIKDPLSGKAVIICKYRAVSELFTEHGSESALSHPDDLIKPRLRVIPIKGVGADGVLMGFMPDRAGIKRYGREDNVSVVIAVDYNEGDFMGFDALLPASIL